MLKAILFPVYCVLLLISSVAGGCKKESEAVVAPNPTPVVAGAKTYLALGDSYTIGQSVGAEERFPFLAAASLRAQGVSINNPRYIATTGWTTANLQSAINGAGSLGAYDLVTLLIGVNDQYQGVDTALYRTRFTQLLQKSIELAGGKKTQVFVLSIPDYSATPFVSPGSKPRVSAEIDWFNSINKQVTVAYGVSYIDITPLTRQAANDPSLLANDGLHYSGKEHKLWADLLVAMAKPVLQ
ncbi:MAG: lysophospholipase and related esterase [Flaviaesturariibacter sp.]|nr:lysophospholipase and related esterase [Flaviaesturariibacter sp.]